MLRINFFFKYCADAIFSLVYPPRCVICSEPVFEGTCYCKKCRREIKPIEEFCGKCSAKIEHCFCNNWQYEFSKLFFINYYESMLKTFVKRLKYSGCKISGRIIGKELAFILKKREKCLKNCVLVPVPLHQRRLKWRGYNQSAVIAKEISKLTRIPYFGDKVLTRIKNSVSQTGLDYTQRKNNIDKAFVVKNIFAVKGKTVLLIDDVLTTGATTAECVKVLKKAGVKDIFCLTAAYRMKNI